MLEAIYQKNKNVYVIRYNRNNKSNFKEVTPPNFLFVPYKDGNYKDFFTNQPLTKIQVSNDEYNENIDLLTAQFGEVYELDKRIFLTYPLWKKQTDFKSRIWYLDIEAIDLNNKVFPNPKDADAPITHIQIYDNIDEVNYIFMTKDFENPKNKAKYNENTKFIVIPDEKKMLKEFARFIQEKRPFIITAWNGDYFDFAYIYNRFVKLNINPNSLSPLGKSSIRDMDKFQKVEILGLELIDALELYKKIVLSPRQSYSLEAIAQIELGEGQGKVDYGEYKNIFNFYEKNYDKFIDYAVQDTIVLKNIIEATGIMDLALTMSKEMGCNPSEILGTTTPWTIYLKLVMLDKKLIFTENKYAVEGSIKGGFVKEPIKGYHEWGSSFDYNSLYPSIMVMNNISPDTYIPYNELPSELKELYDRFRDENEEEFLENIEKIQNVMKKYPNIVFSGLGFFKKDKQGLIPELVESFYYGRKKDKQKMLLAEAILANNKE